MHSQIWIARNMDISRLQNQCIADLTFCLMGPPRLELLFRFILAATTGPVWTAYLRRSSRTAL